MTDGDDLARAVERAHFMDDPGLPLTLFTCLMAIIPASIRLSADAPTLHSPGNCSHSVWTAAKLRYGSLERWRLWTIETLKLATFSSNLA